MAGPSDILTAVQNGVVALNDLGKQVAGSFNNISGQLTSLSSLTALSSQVATLSSQVTTLSSQVAILQAAPAITAGSWTVWNPTVIPSVGAFTTSSATGGYFAIGKLVHFSVTITITTVGTASGTMTIALPVGTPARNAAVPATNLAAGFGGYGVISSTGSNIFSILKSDNTTYIFPNSTTVLTGIYEQT